jgi:hypothetical protein
MDVIFRRTCKRRPLICHGHPAPGSGPAVLRERTWLWSWPALPELASFFGQLKGLAFSLVEALGVGPVNVGADDAVEGYHRVPGTRAALAPWASTMMTRA